MIIIRVAIINFAKMAKMLMQGMIFFFAMRIVINALNAFVSKMYKLLYVVVFLFLGKLLKCT